MNIELIVVGKMDTEQMSQLFELYAKRVNHYCKFSLTTIPDVKGGRGVSPNMLRRSEGEAILRQITDGDYVVVLDERGRQHRSVEFAQWIQKRMNSGVKRLVFVVGGAFGFSEEIYGRANERISLSAMTFTHQFVRVIFAEQIYRAFTILRNEPYHNE